MYDFRTLAVNGLEVDHSARPTFHRRVTSSRRSRARTVGTDVDADEVLDRADALANRFEPVPDFTCAACTRTMPLVELATKGGAFANVSFRFWNWWPLTKAFVQKVEALCGARVTVLHDRI